MQAILWIISALSILFVNDGKSWISRSDRKFPQSFFREKDAPPTTFRIEKSDEFVSKAIDQILNLLLEKAAPCFFFYLTAKLIMKQLVTTTEQIMSIIYHGSETFDPNKLPSSSFNISRFLPANVSLTNSEIEVLTTGVLDPLSINGDLEDLGGIDSVKQVATSLCSFLMTPANDTRSNFQPASFLLFGPPGCGKSALVRGLCKQFNVPTIQVMPSLLLRKYVGETSQLTKAVFSLAVKLQPCILFCDEMDSLFRTRTSDDAAVDRNIKTEFMQLWDDLTRAGAKVMVLGSSNRPQDLDAAIQRRFERSFLLGLPDDAAREDIFRRTLREYELAASPPFDFYRCVDLTKGYAPSDIQALCKAALQISAERQTSNSNDNSISSNKVASPANVGTLCLTIQDIEDAASSFYPTSWRAHSFESLSATQSPPLDSLIHRKSNDRSSKSTVDESRRNAPNYRPPWNMNPHRPDSSNQFSVEENSKDVDKEDKDEDDDDSDEGDDLD